jgi:hypothetical protein
MSEININPNSINNYPTSRALPAEERQENTAQPQDEVKLSRSEESLAKKIIRFPGRALGKVAGAATGAISAPLHVLPGAVKGIACGLEGKGTGLFHLTQWTQNLALGAGAGMMLGGPVGAAVGAGAAALFTGVKSFVGYKTEAYDKMMKDVEKTVDKAVADNTGPAVKVAVQNMTEGSIIGGAAAAKSGWKVGMDAGQGFVEGVFGAVEGLGEGVYEAGKSIFQDIKGKKE